MQKITEGQLCTAQAVLKQVGINGVALTCVILNFFTPEQRIEQDLT
jgi:hypothetical protein